MKFQLESTFQPTGDQPQAIESITDHLSKGIKEQTLLGVTGSGKTFTMANVIQNVQKPTLIISHNKTLTAQLAQEFQEFFPNNAVHYFVSYYDYYQPEAYVPTSDTYIEKDASINEEIDRLRHAATQSLISRKDVIIVASVSCIYGMGSPQEYTRHTVKIEANKPYKRKDLLQQLINIQFTRNDIEFPRGTFRIKGDIIEIHQKHSDDIIRLELFGNDIERISIVNELTGEILQDKLDSILVFPATHFVTEQSEITRVTSEIAADLEKRIKYFEQHGKLLEKQRIEERTRFDMEMLEQTGVVGGIENYSRYFDRRQPGEPPNTLIDFFPDDFLMFIDESHITIPQIGGMLGGDRARKKSLIDYGFRLPSAADNRPLSYKEFAEHINQVVYVSATPKEYEITRSGPAVTEQLIRPTGLLDPSIDVRPTKNQIDDLIKEIKDRVTKKQRVLITTLTKRMAEDLAEYLLEAKVKALYIHSDLDTFERLETLEKLREGKVDALVGINLLREGLDLPEVSLVCILDADKEGFLRNRISLIQTMGRAARHSEGHVILYADKMTASMKDAIQETTRRREIQMEHNKKNNITPTTIKKAIRKIERTTKKEEKTTINMDLTEQERDRMIQDLKQQMEIASQNLEFERAIELRDQLEIYEQLTAATRSKRKR